MDNTPWKWTPPKNWDGKQPPPYVGCSSPHACQGPNYCENPANCDYGVHPCIVVHTAPSEGESE